MNFHNVRPLASFSLDESRGDWDFKKASEAAIDRFIGRLHSPTKVDGLLPVNDAQDVTEQRQSVERDDVEPFLFPRTYRADRAARHFHALQEWEGYVVQVGESSFCARLVDLTQKTQNEDEQVEFELEDVSASDQRLLKEGAIFRWVIGYQRTPGGQRQRVSQIVFRRLPAWSKRDLAEAKQDASTLYDALQELGE